MPRPEPGPDQVLIAVSACGVCRTDLHVADGELPDPKLPLVLGHEVVGRVVARGAAVSDLRIDQRVGVPWLGWTCGQCRDCRAGRENLCDQARFHGYHLDGGYADFMVADARYALPIPEGYEDVEAAPLLCAGLIGYRALRMTGEADRIGFYGFGAPSFPYALLWGERVVRSVANLTRKDGLELLELAARTRVRTTTHTYPLEDANRALGDLRAGRVLGAAVLEVR